MPPEVEIIPWTHHVAYRSHRDMVNFVKQLPKNSPIAVELDENTFSKIMSIIQGRPKGYYGSPTGQMLAGLELVFECEKRGIKIIPIENIAQHKEWYSERNREKSAARRIQMALRNFKSHTLPVIVGVDHAHNLSQDLENLGIKSKIKTDIFKEKKLIERTLRLNRLLSKVENNPALYQEKENIKRIITENFKKHEIVEIDPYEMRDQFKTRAKNKIERVKTPKKKRINLRRQLLLP